MLILDTARVIVVALITSAVGLIVGQGDPFSTFASSLPYGIAGASLFAAAWIVKQIRDLGVDDREKVERITEENTRLSVQVSELRRVVDRREIWIDALQEDARRHGRTPVTDPTRPSPG